MNRFESRMIIRLVALAFALHGIGGSVAAPEPAIASPEREFIWDSPSGMTREPVLLLEDENGEVTGQLLYPPTKILRVYAPVSQREYAPSDFSVTGERTLVYTGTGEIPFTPTSELLVDKESPQGLDGHIDGIHNLLFAEAGFRDKQVLIDYESDSDWEGPLPRQDPAPFSAFLTKLKSGRPVTVVLLGDSISRGENHRDAPSYIDQFVHYLRQHSRSPVHLHNLSVSGKSSPWGMSQADAAAALNPDLFIIAFGMNDASSRYPSKQYARQINGMVERIRLGNPDVACVLVSGMCANPLWNKANPGLHEQYHRELLAIAGQTPNTAVCDVYGMWQALVAKKGFVSLTGNGINHPNDFGHRLYADVLISTVCGDARQN